MVAGQPEVFIVAGGADIFHPAAHSLKVFRQEAFIAIHIVQLPGNDGDAVAPARTNAGLEDGKVHQVGAEAQHRTRIQLLQTNISQPFAEEIEATKDAVLPTTVDFVKAHLTDDDIEVVQQWAMWYFTNRAGNDKYGSFGPVTISKDGTNFGSYVDTVGSDMRQKCCYII